MRYSQPKELEELHDSIPDEYWCHPETAPAEVREQMELWRQKSREYDWNLRKELFGL